VIAVELATAYERLGRLFLFVEAPEAKAILDKVYRICKETPEKDANRKLFERKAIDGCAALAQLAETKRDYAGAAKWHREAEGLARAAQAKATGAEAEVSGQWAKQCAENAELCLRVPRVLEDINAADSPKPQHTIGLLTARVAVLVERRDFAAALATAEKIDKLAGETAEGRFRAACAFAQATRAAKDDARSKCQDRAMAALKKAVDLGFKNVGQLAADPQLASIRKLPEFQALLQKVKPLL
jgi:hypothetical protein